MTSKTTPFHAGELEAQQRAEVGDVSAWAGGFIRDYMPEQHRAFFTSLPFLVIAGGDEAGRPWVTILEGPAGFVASPDPRTLTVAATLDPQEPLSPTLASGTEIGMLGMELATRRRNRLNGVFRPEGGSFAIDVCQSFGNCPQYIQEREWHRVGTGSKAVARVSDRLDDGQAARVAAADTLFIGSGYQAGGGYDASHRGGEPGFVQVTEDGTLRIPDYAGNNYFNTIGNLIRDPRVGLLFVDFETGGLLQVTGRSQIDWAPADSKDPKALRMIDVAVEQVIDRPGALALRWCRKDDARLQLKVIDKVVESDRITSFHLAAADDAPLEPFEAGQYLPVELKIPGHPGRVRRSYSLSGSPFAPTYRLSIKREDRGVASRFLHDQIVSGNMIEARRPSGEFVVPSSHCPLVLVSAGVGVTPMLSLLHAAVSDRSDRPVWFVHGARDGRSHALRAEVDALVMKSANIVRRVFYSAPREEDLAGVHFDATGRVTAEDLLALEAGADAYYMLCGPARFLGEIRAGLEFGGVPPGQIHFETFGPTR
jgi:ferredoxin-NADP reductase/predicted pyridoxine 5'-phosphate oxidase superfamily flavin-nucleotide-binding protein